MSSCLDVLLPAFLADRASVPSALDADEASSRLDATETVDALADAPAAVASHLDVLIALLKSFAALDAAFKTKLVHVIVSSLSAQTELLAADLTHDNIDALSAHRSTIELLCFLLQWIIYESSPAKSSSTAAHTRQRSAKGRSAATNRDQSHWDSAAHIQTALDVLCRLLNLKLAKVWQTSAERDTLVSLATRPLYFLTESETLIKTVAIRMRVFKVLGIAIKHHGHAFGAQTCIVQALLYFEHLPEYMAEFLQILIEQYDYPQLTDDILRELSCKEFSSTDTKSPKYVASFLAKLSELLPNLVNKQMTLLIKHLDSESYTVRCGIIEVCGNLICDISKQDQLTEPHQGQLDSFFDLLEERFLDVNPYCRSKVIQVLVKLCDLPSKFPQRRQKFADLAVQSLEDKSSNVRRNTVKFLSKLIATHPFGLLHGGHLALSEWNDRLAKVTAELGKLEPEETIVQKEDQIDDELLDEQTQGQVATGDVSMVDVSMADISMIEEDNQIDLSLTQTQKKGLQQPQVSQEQLGKLNLTRKYYAEAVKFIKSLHSGSKIISQLLASKTKTEVLEAMDFFITADAYKLESAKEGIRKMLHLIWTKGNSDEGRGVQTHLIESYKCLYFDPPDEMTINESATFVARNMMSLTYGATLAELTSLEQLLSTMMKQNLISDDVIVKLWQVYGIQKKEISKSQRRGAIIVLTMLALADPDIVIRELELVLRVGLGSHGQTDLALARYSCIALQRISGKPQVKGVPEKESTRLPNDHPILLRLAATVIRSIDDKDWLGLAEQAINAIYALAQHPDILCSQIITTKAKAAFQLPTEQTQSQQDIPSIPTTVKLSHLFFVVGHVAIKQIVHIEACEMEFKRRKAASEKAKKDSGLSDKNEPAGDDLEMVGGTTEDDFTDAIQHIREKELLYGEKSLLAVFGPLIVEVISSNLNYPDPDLQAATAIALAKLMCVSAEFCETNLPLLLTVLERSVNPISRSNIVIALGDMTVCFNHLIDENTDFLYRRLRDQDTSVKKTCLMTLTFLILAGQVKVKGQLGEMAKCLEDPDRHIADLAKMFFTELATKENAIYNGFSDIFSALSAGAEPIEEDALHRILKVLMSFIEKEKHARQLAEKLASRLPRCETIRQWNDVSYALSLLPHKSDDIQKVLSEGFQYGTGISVP
ncbi:Condensin complex subunit 1 [Neolecta irregularis DAH-3]|uniref:Condensin complex subunit 1 n=1 Tax=Neolecta irregularis (strain DAH-3) TaxID=1198029 RepID=A0A1U7LHQ6_NEOID|nr:Condensin complex subunit 1 [Neolecta irregularis DAH-3]|eukprot:OLL22186.1 Condensin complex subunit 1 [Neolecta irregularis DAH-3]